MYIYIYVHKSMYINKNYKYIYIYIYTTYHTYLYDSKCVSESLSIILAIYECKK